MAREQSSQRDRQESHEDELDKTQKAVTAGFGAAVGIIAHVAIGLAAGLPDMVVFWSSMALAAVVGIYLGGEYYV